MSPPKTSSGLCAQCGSATSRAAELFSKRKSARMASPQGVPLPGIKAICASLQVIVRCVNKTRRPIIGKGPSRRKDLRRSSKSPPPRPLTLNVYFPSSPTTSPTEPTPPPPPSLGTGTITLADPIRIAEPPRKARAGNDLRHFLAQRRAASDEAAATSAPAPPHRARDPPPATPTPPGASRPSKLQRRAQDTPRAAEAIAPAPTLVPRAPVLPPARPSSTPAASDAPDTLRPTRSQKRKIYLPQVRLRPAQLRAAAGTPHHGTNRNTSQCGTRDAAASPSAASRAPGVSSPRLTRQSPASDLPRGPSAPGGGPPATRHRGGPPSHAADADGRVTRRLCAPCRLPRDRRRRGLRRPAGSPLSAPLDGRTPFRHGHLAACWVSSPEPPAGPPLCGHAQPRRSAQPEPLHLQRRTPVAGS
jgi:hypothetical protein